MSFFLVLSLSVGHTQTIRSASKCDKFNKEFKTMQRHYFKMKERTKLEKRKFAKNPTSKIRRDHMNLAIAFEKAKEAELVKLLATKMGKHCQPLQKPD